MAYGLLYDFLMGQSTRAYEYFGAHFIEYQTKEDAPHKKGRKKTITVKGVVFRLYAPMADDVSVIGEFNNWDPRANKMTKVDDCGVWETFIPNLYNYQAYKYHFKIRDTRNHSNNTTSRLYSFFNLGLTIFNRCYYNTVDFTLKFNFVLYDI